ncbi:glycosyltransferase family 2 protein [Ligilactobacillus sp. WILCCON 0076]|uniref:Glycosyltransferase family 2 protein n=1 Tax=Ligilactobacillus ubinensis TaxID=2876789 RepID=A0A9X2JPS8_9LACO|nr:glycosyltransferase family A protein [Ligilactobacillus ubinensis]MCP0888046.1 glycosyltransferase family 2 protein [Ligilactobacillus ubinensis]
MNLEKDKVSIVVPVFNASKYLAKCIESIEQQTYRNLEIILVDDGSTDDSKKIISFYAKSDCRIKPIYKKNTGVSNTRNVGLSKATGKYVCFSDADDYLMKDYIEYLMLLIKNNNADISLTTKMFGDFDTKQVKKDKVKLMTSSEAVIGILAYNIPIGVYSKMFRNNFLKKNNLNFIEELYMGEGFNFNIDCFQRAKSICVGRRKIYYYRRNNLNSVTTKFSVSKWRNALEAINSIENRLIIKRNEDIENALKFAKWRTTSDAYDALVIADGKKNNVDLYYKWVSFVKKEALCALYVPTSLKNKVRAIIMKVYPAIIPKILIFRKKTHNINIQ